MGNNSQTTQQYQSSQFAPWAPAIPGLTNIINQLTGMSTAPTSAQTGATGTLQQEAGAVPTNMGSQGTGVVNNLLGSTTAPQVGQWNAANNQAQGVWSPYLSSSYTNPMSAPGMGAALSTMNQDITNNINSQFSAAGRENSPANTQALARGLSQGEGGLLTSEYNALSGNQLAANNAAYGAGAGTATGTAQLQQLPYQNELQALTAMQGLPGLYTAPGTTQLGAANTAYNLPYSNMQLPTTLMGGLAGLGGTSSGYGQSTTTQPVNPFTTALGAGLGLWALSDERLKEGIEPIGILHNGTNIYRYRFKGSPKTEIGVLAQEVERTRPEAVVDIGLWRGGPSVKMVDYAKATEPPPMAA